jgi:hypothetical protein
MLNSDNIKVTYYSFLQRRNSEGFILKKINSLLTVEVAPLILNNGPASRAKFPVALITVVTRT